MGIYYVDGVFVPAAEAVLPLSDLAILRGYGVFDFMRTYGGRPFHLDNHIRRLQNSADLIGLYCPWSHDELSEIAEETLKRNDYPEANIRLLITGGDSDDSITPGKNPRLLVMVTPVKTFPASWYEAGVKIITAEATRYIPGSKSTDYIQAILTLDNARAVDAVESLYIDEQGRVLEGTTSNLFAVFNGQLVTPSADILPGVTRDVVLDIAASTFKPELRVVTRDELYKAEEVFMTSSNKEVLPVRQVDQEVIGNGQPGEVTRQVMDLFRAHTDRYARENS